MMVTTSSPVFSALHAQHLRLGHAPPDAQLSIASTTRKEKVVVGSIQRFGGLVVCALRLGSAGTFATRSACAIQSRTTAYLSQPCLAPPIIWATVLGPTAPGQACEVVCAKSTGHVPTNPDMTKATFHCPAGNTKEKRFPTGPPSTVFSCHPQNNPPDTYLFRVKPVASAR